MCCPRLITATASPQACFTSRHLPPALSAWYTGTAARLRQSRRDMSTRGMGPSEAGGLGFPKWPCVGRRSAGRGERAAQKEVEFGHPSIINAHVLHCVNHVHAATIQQESLGPASGLAKATAHGRVFALHQPDLAIGLIHHRLHASDATAGMVLEVHTPLLGK